MLMLGTCVANALKVVQLLHKHRHVVRTSVCVLIYTRRHVVYIINYEYVFHVTAAGTNHGSK